MLEERAGTFNRPQSHIYVELTDLNHNEEKNNGSENSSIGFRLGTTRDWVSHWFGVNPKDYRVQVLEDHKIREHINNDLGDSSGISHIQIQRNSEDLAINIHTSRPGIVIGRGGSNVDKLKKLYRKNNF